MTGQEETSVAIEKNSTNLTLEEGRSNVNNDTESESKNEATVMTQ